MCGWLAPDDVGEVSNLFCFVPKKKKKPQNKNHGRPFFFIIISLVFRFPSWEDLVFVLRDDSLGKRFEETKWKCLYEEMRISGIFFFFNFWEGGLVSRPRPQWFQKGPGRVNWSGSYYYSLSKSEAEMEGLDWVSSVNVIFSYSSNLWRSTLFCFLLLLFVSYLAKKFHLNENVPGEREINEGGGNCFNISAGTKWKGDSHYLACWFRLKCYLMAGCCCCCCCCSGVTFPVTIGHQKNKNKKKGPKMAAPWIIITRRYDEIFRKRTLPELNFF